MKAKVVYDMHGNVLGMTTEHARAIEKNAKPIQKEIAPEIVFDEIEVKVNAFASGPATEVDFFRYVKKSKLSKSVDKVLIRKSIGIPLTCDLAI